MKVLISLFMLFGFSCNVFAAPQTVTNAPQDNPGREFLMACTYGVLAGALVGAASLAFTSQPGENLGRVARGASIGLYTGILLGLYVVYVVPGLEEGPEEEPVAKLDRIPFTLSPLFGRSGFRHEPRWDGLQADVTVLRF